MPEPIGTLERVLLAVQLLDGSWHASDEDNSTEEWSGEMQAYLEQLRAAYRAYQEKPSTVRDLVELVATFNMRREADMRAIRRWQAAHPGNDLVWPDHADMVVRLLDEHDRMADDVAKLERREAWLMKRGSALLSEMHGLTGCDPSCEKHYHGTFDGSLTPDAYREALSTDA